MQRASIYKTLASLFVLRPQWTIGTLLRKSPSATMILTNVRLSLANFIVVECWEEKNNETNMRKCGHSSLRSIARLSCWIFDSVTAHHDTTNGDASLVGSPIILFGYPVTCSYWNPPLFLLYLLDLSPPHPYLWVSHSCVVVEQLSAPRDHPQRYFRICRVCHKATYCFQENASHQLLFWERIVYSFSMTI